MQVLALETHTYTDDSAPVATVHGVLDVPVTRIETRLAECEVWSIQRFRLSDGAVSEIPVEVEMLDCSCSLTSAGRDALRRQSASRDLFCYRVGSTDPSREFAWSRWSPRCCGRFNMLQVGGRSYLSWAEGASVCFAEAQTPVHPCRSLDAHLLRRGAKEPGVVEIPIVELVPATQSWGVNVLFRDVDIVGLSFDASGLWTVRVVNQQRTESCVLIEDPSARLRWRVAGRWSVSAPAQA